MQPKEQAPVDDLYWDTGLRIKDDAVVDDEHSSSIFVEVHKKIESDSIYDSSK